MRKKTDTLTISIFILIIAALCGGGVNKIKTSSVDSAEKPLLPAVVGQWTLSDEIVIPDKFLRILGTKTASLGEYDSDTGEKLQLYILTSENRRASIHQPEYCYMGSGANEILKKGAIALELGDGKHARVNYFFLQTEKGFKLVNYFYTANDLVTNNYYRQQLYFLLGRLKGETVQGSLVRISKFVKNDDFSNDQDSLQVFTSQLVNRFLP